MVAIGAGTMKAAALGRDLEERQAQLAEVRAQKADLEQSLATARDEGTTSLATLRALEDAHADLLDSLFALRASGDAADLTAERDALRASLTAAEQALQATPDRDGTVERENADLRRRITEVADAVVGQGRLPRAEAFTASRQEPERV